jgi:hypothetical protein
MTPYLERIRNIRIKLGCDFRSELPNIPNWINVLLDCPFIERRGLGSYEIGKSQAQALVASAYYLSPGGPAASKFSLEIPSSGSAFSVSQASSFGQSGCLATRLPGGPAAWARPSSRPDFSHVGGDYWQGSLSPWPELLSSFIIHTK